MLRVPILLYHWFHEPASPIGRSREFGMHPEEFRAQMRWLVDAGYSAVSVADVYAAARGAARLPRRPVVITFDDAYLDFSRHGIGVLSDLGLTATMFVVAGLVGGSNVWDRKYGEPERQLMGWPELRAAAAAGIEIGSHSVTHPDMRRLDAETLRSECVNSRAILEDGLGRPVPFFAYPHGRYDARVRDAVVEAGYEGACAVLLRPTDLLRSDDFALMRAIIHADKGRGDFRLRMWLAAPFHRLRRTTASQRPA